MLRQSAVDMENSQSLLSPEESNSVHMFRQKYLCISCILILSHGLSISLGFFAGQGTCDGSNIF